MLTHSFAAVQSPLFVSAQVPVVGLQRPLVQAALTPAKPQRSWMPSCGTGVPAASMRVQVNVARWQKRPPEQSASAQQLEVPCGMHALVEPSALALQRPDWQRKAPVATVQGPVPSGTPHWPLPAQTFDVHSFAAVHAVVFAAAHVFAIALHVPVAHTAAARASVHTPSWRPSIGSAAPAALSARHASAERSHHSPEAQSPST